MTIRVTKKINGVEVTFLTWWNEQFDEPVIRAEIGKTDRIPLCEAPTLAECIRKTESVLRSEMRIIEEMEEDAKS